MPTGLAPIPHSERVAPWFGRILKEWRVAGGLGAILAYFFLITNHGLRTYFNNDDVMNLVALHGYWRWPWWHSVLSALTVVTPVYRPMGDLFYRLLYSFFGLQPLPFRVACFALMAVNLGLFFRLALLLSLSRMAALLSTLVFSVHAALGDLYFSTGTVYDILCVSFTLAAFGSYVNVRRGGGDLRVRDVIVLLVLYGGALDSKEMAASLPLGLLLYEGICAPKTPLGRLWRRVLPLFLAFALTAAFLAIKMPALAENALYRPQLSLSTLMANTSHYVGLLLYQERLGITGLIAVAVFAAAVSLVLRRRVAFFGLCYGFGALLPVLPMAARDGFVLGLPLAGFALFAGALLSVASRAADRLLPRKANPSFWKPLGQCTLFLLLAASLFVVHSRHWRDQSEEPGRVGTVMRQTIQLLQARHPTLPSGTRLLFTDDPLPKNRFTLLFLVQAAYGDPSLWIDRQNNFATPLDPAEYAIFDYLVSIRDGKLEEHRLPPIRLDGPTERVIFVPDSIEAGGKIQMRVGSHANAFVDIEFQKASRFTKSRGVALRWAELGSDGVATIAVSRLDDPGSVLVTAVRVSGNGWQKASGGFSIRRPPLL